jgi:hypothetical protein
VLSNGTRVEEDEDGWKMMERVLMSEESDEEEEAA